MLFTLLTHSAPYYLVIITRITYYIRHNLLTKRCIKLLSHLQCAINITYIRWHITYNTFHHSATQNTLCYITHLQYSIYIDYLMLCNKGSTYWWEYSGLWLNKKTNIKYSCKWLTVRSTFLQKGLWESSTLSFHFVQNALGVKKLWIIL